MADITFDDSTFKRTICTEGELAVEVKGTIELTSEGGTVDDLKASDFYLEKIYACYMFVKSDNSEGLVAFPDYDYGSLLLKAAATNAPADYTGTYRFHIVGLGK